MEVNIGGNRLGSGGKMTTNLHGYNRSTHNLNTRFLSSIAPGVLYPFYTNIGLKGDSFEMDLAAAVRTLPTQGPLFGSFKLQADIFVCPLRLYQGILHNNPINIGMKMGEVYLPKIKLYGRKHASKVDYFKDISNNCLVKYTGFSGFGISQGGDYDKRYTTRKINGVPVLAYYDIFKNYYANKQEDYAYVIRPQIDLAENLLNKFTISVNTSTGTDTEEFDEPFFIENYMSYKIYILSGPDWDMQHTLSDFYIKLVKDNKTEQGTLQELADKGIINGKAIQITSDASHPEAIILPLEVFTDKNKGINWLDGQITLYSSQLAWDGKINLYPFRLENIDQMRMELLSKNQLGDEFVINDEPIGHNYPYAALYETYDIPNRSDAFITNNAYPMNGLVVKTYQSDIFNNWLKTEFIEGPDSITELTRIDTSSGLTMDTLNITQKIYNMLNRIAVAGGTYQDWEEVNYDEKARRLCETPMWVGGYSDEIIFDEVIQTSESGETPLGKMGGRGRTTGNQHGGKIHFKCEEACVIMGIVSITPRIAYSQGNAWYLTDLNSIDDLHKPALDGIGYQNLITEQMAHFDTIFDEDTNEITRYSAGKTPAWLNYMTDVDKVYGDFAADGGANFMVLDRNYEMEEDGRIKDLTTYIDPAKFNYAFAYAELDAQNFWVNVNTDIKARRKMSAKVIPNL